MKKYFFVSLFVLLLIFPFLNVIAAAPPFGPPSAAPSFPADSDGPVVYLRYYTSNTWYYEKYRIDLLPGTYLQRVNNAVVIIGASSSKPVKYWRTFCYYNQTTQKWSEQWDGSKLTLWSVPNSGSYTGQTTVAPIVNDAGTFSVDNVLESEVSIYDTDGITEFYKAEPFGPQKPGLEGTYGIDFLNISADTLYCSINNNLPVEIVYKLPPQTKPLADFMVWLEMLDSEGNNIAIDTPNLLLNDAYFVRDDARSKYDINSGVGVAYGYIKRNWFAGSDVAYSLRASIKFTDTTKPSYVTNTVSVVFYRGAVDADGDGIDDRTNEPIPPSAPTEGSDDVGSIFNTIIDFFQNSGQLFNGFMIFTRTMISFLPPQVQTVFIVGMCLMIGIVLKKLIF